MEHNQFCLAPWYLFTVLQYFGTRGSTIFFVLQRTSYLEPMQTGELMSVLRRRIAKKREQFQDSGEHLVLQCTVVVA